MCAAQSMWWEAHLVLSIKDISLQKYHALPSLESRVMNNLFSNGLIMFNVAESKPIFY